MKTLKQRKREMLERHEQERAAEKGHLDTLQRKARAFRKSRDTRREAEEAEAAIVKAKEAASSRATKRDKERRALDSEITAAQRSRSDKLAAEVPAERFGTIEQTDRDYVGMWRQRRGQRPEEDAVERHAAIARELPKQRSRQHATSLAKAAEKVARSLDAYGFEARAAWKAADEQARERALASLKNPERDAWLLNERLHAGAERSAAPPESTSTRSRNGVDRGITTRERVRLITESSVRVQAAKGRGAGEWLAAIVEHKGLLRSLGVPTDAHAFAELAAIEAVELEQAKTDAERRTIRAKYQRERRAVRDKTIRASRAKASAAARG